MPKAAQRNIVVSRGSTVPLVWRFRNADRTPYRIAGSLPFLEITWRGGAIVKAPGDLGWRMDAATAEVMWTPTRTEVSAIPRGSDGRPVARYVLRLSVPGGEDRPLVEGLVEVAG